jgi:hypothetical protein
MQPTQSAHHREPLEAQQLHAKAEHIDLGNGIGSRRVGEDVPPCRIYAIEPKMNTKESRLYNDLTHHLFGKLFVGDTNMIKPKETIRKPKANSNDNPEGIQNSGVHRFLMHSTLNLHLARLTYLNHKGLSADEKKAAKKRRNNWVDVDFDHRASFTFVKTRHGPEYAIPADRLSLATYLCAKSVKIRYILYLLGEWVLGLQEKVILVFEYPMSQW